MRRLGALLALLAVMAPAPATARPHNRPAGPAAAIRADGVVAVAWIERGSEVRVALGRVGEGFAPPHVVGASADPEEAYEHPVVLLPGDGSVIVAWDRRRMFSVPHDRFERSDRTVFASISALGDIGTARPLTEPVESGGSGIAAAADDAGRAWLGASTGTAGWLALRGAGGSLSAHPVAVGSVESVALGGGEGVLAHSTCGRGGCPLTVSRIPGNASQVVYPGAPDVPEAQARMSANGYGIVAWRAGARGGVTDRAPGGAFGPADELPGGLVGTPAPAIADSGDGLVLYSRAAAQAGLGMVRRAPGTTRYVAVQAPATAPAHSPALAIARDGSGLAAWLQGDVAHAARREPDGTWSPPAALGRAGNGDVQAVAASESGALIAWNDLGADRRYRLHVLLVPREGTPRPITLATHDASLERPRSRPPHLLGWTVRGRRGRVGVSLRCRGRVECAGRITVGPRHADFRMTPGHTRRLVVNVRRRRLAVLVRLDARVHGRLYRDRSRRVRLR